jgi:hypothetical protein
MLSLKIDYVNVVPSREPEEIVVQWQSPLRDIIGDWQL